MDFVAIDIETANPNMASICQIGIASFRNAELESEWVSLVNPADWFFPGNVGVHGITEEMVEDAPTIRQLESKLRKLLVVHFVSSYHNDMAARRFLRSWTVNLQLNGLQFRL